MHIQQYLREHVYDGVLMILLILGLIPIIAVKPTPEGLGHRTAAVEFVDMLYVVLACCALVIKRRSLLSWKPNILIFPTSASICLLFFGWQFSLHDVELLKIIGPSAVSAGIMSCYAATLWWRNPESQQHPPALRTLNGYAGWISDAARQV